MVQAPQVQSLEQIMAELAPATSQQTDIIKKKQANLGVQSAAQLAGLDATKSNEMNAINTQATGRGMAFSGIPLDEQATYLGEKYLPAVANLKTAQEESNISLEQQNADLFSQNYKSAYDTLGTQKAAQNQWNLAQMQNEASAAEAERNRQFQASQNAADRSLQQARYDKENEEDEEMTPYEAAASVINSAAANGLIINSDIFQNARDQYIYAGSGGEKTRDQLSSDFASQFWKYVPKDSRTDESANGWRAYYYG